MKVMVISFLLVFLISAAQAIEIDLNSPESADINEEFTVSIEADSTETFDIKIFVHNSVDEKISSEEYISEIYDSKTEKWLNPWFYLKAYFPDQKEYSLRVTKSSGEREICVRLRKTGVQSFDTACKEITVSGTSSKSDSPEEKQNTQEEKKEEQKLEDNEEDFIATSFNTEPKKGTAGQATKILLNPQGNNKEFSSTKKEYTRASLVYIFLVLCIAIIIFLAWNKL